MGGGTWCRPNPRCQWGVVPTIVHRFRGRSSTAPACCQAHELEHLEQPAYLLAILHFFEVERRPRVPDVRIPVSPRHYCIVPPVPVCEAYSAPKHPQTSFGHSPRRSFLPCATCGDGCRIA